MNYHISKTVSGDFMEVISRVKEELKKEGFGVLTEIDIKKTFKSKIDVDFRNYTILGACNPGLAYQALSAEKNVGTMLPCNVILQEVDEGKIEISAVNPQASMMAIKNTELEKIAGMVTQKLQNVVAGI